jgi:hypothetical protein
MVPIEPPNVLVTAVIACSGQIKGGLQIKPEASFHAEVPFQTQGRVSRHRSPTGDEFRNSVVRNTQSAAQFTRRNPKGTMNSSFSISPGCVVIRFISQRLSAIVSVIVNDFNIFRAFIAPTKTDPPLLVDPNAELDQPISFQCFQMIAGRDRQRAQ